MKKVTEKKLIAYIGSSVGMAAICATVAYVRDYLPLYLFFWASFGAVAGSCVSRVILHIAYKDYSAEMWQVAIYHFVTAIGIIGLIYSTTWGWASLSAAVIVGMGLMACGTRFIDQFGGTLGAYKIDHEVRYFPKDDVPGAEEDPERPICLYDGKALTIVEAEEAGLESAAESARKTLYAIYGIILEKKEEDK